MASISCNLELFWMDKGPKKDWILIIKFSWCYFGWNHFWLHSTNMPLCTKKAGLSQLFPIFSDILVTYATVPFSIHNRGHQQACLQKRTKTATGLNLKPRFFEIFG